MNRVTDKGKGFLKEKMAGYQADPPSELWDSISGKLGKDGGSRRRYIIILSAAASLALAITLGITLTTRDIPMDSDLVLRPEEERSSREEPGKRLEEKVVQTLAEMDQESAEEGVVSEPLFNEADPDNSAKLAVLDSREEAEAVPLTGAISIAQPPEQAIEKAAEQATEQEVGQRPEEAVEPGPEEMEDLDLALDAGAPVGDDFLPELEESRDKNPRWVLGAMLSPLYTYRDAQPDALAGTPDQESGTVAYAAGVSVGYKASRRLAIESGLLYNKMGISIGNPGIQRFSEDRVYAPAAPEAQWDRVLTISNTVGNIVSNSGEIYVNNYMMNGSKNLDGFNEVVSEAVYASEGIKQHLDYLELPFNLRYSVLDRDFKIQLLGGMSTNFLVNNYVSMESGGESIEIGYLSNIRKINYSGNAGIGFVYHFLDQLSVSLEPRFRYYLNSVNDATLPSTRPYTFGIYTGINYFF